MDQAIYWRGLRAQLNDEAINLPKAFFDPSLYHATDVEHADKKLQRMEELIATMRALLQTKPAAKPKNKARRRKAAPRKPSK